MAREKVCHNKTGDTMEFEVQMTSMTLDFSSDSFLLHKLLENCFEIICHEALHEGMCLWEFMWAPSRFVWVLPDAALFPFRVVLGSGQTLWDKCKVFSMVLFTGAGVEGLWLLVSVCICVCQNPPEAPVVLCKAVMRGEEKETEKRRWLTVAL